MGLKRNTIQWDDALARAEPVAFVELVGNYFLRQGYRVEHAGAEARRQGQDVGVDLRLHRGDEHVVVQCKHWRACQVPHHDVHELLVTMLNEGATSAILVASGEFTVAALRAGRHDRVRLIDGRTIRALLDPISVLQAAHASDARASAAAPQVFRTPREIRQRAARPYLVPMMVFAGCLIVATGIVRSLSGTAHPSRQATVAENAPSVLSPTPAGRQAIDPANAGASTHVPGMFHPIDHEAARVAVRPIAGVRSASWLDASNFVVIVDGAQQRNPAMIDAVCRALETLGDTLGVVVNLQDVGSAQANAAATLSRNCRLPQVQSSFMQANREVSMVAPDWRDTFAGKQAAQP